MLEEISELVEKAKQETFKSVLGLGIIITLSVLAYRQVSGSDKPPSEAELSFESSNHEDQKKKNRKLAKRSPASIRRSRQKEGSDFEKDPEGLNSGSVGKPPPKSQSSVKSILGFQHNAHHNSYDQNYDNYAESSSRPSPRRSSYAPNYSYPDYSPYVKEDSNPVVEDSSLDDSLSTDTTSSFGVAGLPVGQNQNQNQSDQTEDITETASSNSDGNGVSQSSGSNESTVVENPGAVLSCSASAPQGTYTTSIGVTLSCSEVSDIYYCVQMGGGCCDPITTPSTYSAPISISSAGDYCVSFYGESTNLSEQTDVVNLNYTISSIPLNMTVVYPKVQIQTTELPLINQIGSIDFGHPDSYFHQLNLKSHDPGPGGLNWSCSDYLALYGTLAAPIATSLTLNYSVVSLNPSSQIENKIYTNIDYGDNYVVSLIEDRARDVWNCQIQKILFQDFQVYEFTGTRLPAGSGIPLNYGTFTNFGSFKPNGTSISSGSLEHQQGLTIDQSGILNILY